MSELLSTGEMIDRLKVGEVAESDFSVRVTKNERGGIGKVGTPLENILMNGSYLKTKWRILPNYVSFSEAMEALKNGKRVTIEEFEDGDQWGFSPENYKDNRILEGYSLQELYEGKWSVG